jgi:hypothetical protein
LVAGSRPDQIQRRMVSADLPVRRAASRTDISCVADTALYYYYVYYYTASGRIG